MNHAEYLADPAPVPSLSSSIAKLLLYRSPRHAWIAHPKLNPDYKPVFDAKFDLGSAAHALLLEGEDRMVAVDADDWRTKVAKEARDAARAEGKHPVLAHQYIAVQEMVKACNQAIGENEDLKGYTLTDGGISEHTIVWHEGETYMRARLDRVSMDRRLILDYKSTENAEPSAWLRTMMGLGGDIQAAFYLRAVQNPDAKFVFVVQEVETPYAVSFTGMPPAFVELGARKVERAIALWKQCMESGAWPAYSNRICWAEPPVWAQTQWDEKETENGVQF